MLKNFKYERGVRFLDGWRDIRKSQIGDCDDFAYSMARKESKNLLHFIWLILLGNLTLGYMGISLYWVWSKHSNLFPTHMVFYDSRRGKYESKWIDSTYPDYYRWKVSPHKLLPIPLLLPWVLFRVLWGKVYQVIFD